MKLIKLPMSNTPLKSSDLNANAKEFVPKQKREKVKYTALSDLNVNAKEFVPRQNYTKVKLDKLQENILFDNLEKDFVKNNEWLFLV